MIIIIGGGIAGLTLAWHLLDLGEKVTLIEQNHVGSGASWAASAYLEPRLGTSAMRSLEWAAIKAWPEFIQQIELQSQQNVDYHTDGQLRVSFADTLEAIKRDAETRAAQGWDIEWLEGAELSRCAPHLSDSIVGASYLPGVHWVDGRLLCKAIATALENRGATVLEGQKVTRVLHQSGRISGIATQDTTLNASRVILASGLGSNDMLDLPSDIPECRPVKGVILSLAMDKTAPLTRHLIRHPNGTVLCPRSDGRLLVGSTHEDGEISMDVPQATRNQLLKTAAELIPDVANLSIVEETVGIRSLIGDGSLRLGQSSRLHGLYYSLSHAGAGYLRAPAIAEHFARYIIDPTAPRPLIDRFLHRVV